MSPAQVPYPGLRAFERNEAQLFFGRESEIDALVESLARNRFLSVLGASGSGKSSLVRTGVVEVLEGGGSLVANRWQIATFTPGADPIGALAEALLESQGAKPSPTETAALVERLREGPRSIVEWCEQGALPEGTTLLILADQFEELFNYRRQVSASDAHRLAALLVESAASPRAPIYVVLTMRSDYFGACGAFPALAKAVSASLFLTPRMLWDACYDAITLPAAVTGFEIDDTLATRLLNDMERFAPFSGAEQEDRAVSARQADQLPLMQYALNRMWYHAEAQRSAGERDPAGLTADGDAVRLNAKDYEAIGGLEGALAEHGGQVLETLDVPRDAVERVFRALVQGPSVALAVRDPHSVGEIMAITGLDEATVTHVVDRFARDDCQFLRVKGHLGPDAFVDISHESLIRQWGQLSEWLQREAEAGELWRLLLANAVEWEKRERDIHALLHGHLLTDRREWWKASAITEAWAARHASGTTATIAPAEAITLVGEYLTESEAKRDAKIKASRRRAMLASLAAALLTTFSVVGASWWRAQNEQTRLLNLQLAKVNGSLARKNTELDRQRRSAEASAEVARLAQLRASRLTELEKIARKLADRRTSEATQAGSRAMEQARIADEQARAARQAYGQLLANLESSSHLVGSAASPIITVAGGDERGRDTMSVAEQRARLGLLASELLADSGMQVVGWRIDTLLAASKRLSRQPEVETRAELVQARMEVQKGNFTRAFAVYRQVWQREQSTPNEFAFRAATAMISLQGRFDAPLPDVNQQIAWCLQQADQVPMYIYAFAQAQACRVAIAENWLAQNRKKDAVKLLEAIHGLPWESLAAGWDGTGKAPLETDVDRLQVRLKTETLLSQAKASPSSIDPGLLAQAERHATVNPYSEATNKVNFLARAANGDRKVFEDLRQYFDRRTADMSADFLFDILPIYVRWTEANPVPENPTGIEGDRSGTKPDLEMLHIERDMRRVLEALRLNDEVLQMAGNAPPIPRKIYRDKLSENLQIRHERTANFAYEQLLRYMNRNGLIDDFIEAERSGEDPNLTHITSDDKITFNENYNILFDICYDSLLCDLTSKKNAGFGRLLNVIQEAIVRSGDGSLPPAAVDGYDLVAFRQYVVDPKRWRLYRGQENWAYEQDGERFLFRSADNLREFRKAPDRYIPAFSGNAANWIYIGERKPVSPELFCTFSGRVYLFERSPLYCANHVPDQKFMPGFVRDASAEWVRLMHEAPKVVSPLDGVSPIELPTPYAENNFTLPPSGKVYLPRGGRVHPVSGDELQITHGDGSCSVLKLPVGMGLGARISGPRGSGFLLPAGFQLTGPLTAEDGQPVVLTWIWQHDACK